MKSPLDENPISPQELAKALFEMRDSLVELSLALQDSLFEAYLVANSTPKKCAPQDSTQNNSMQNSV